MNIDEPGQKLPTATASRIKMQEHIPAAKRLLEKAGATDLEEIIFGEDARHGNMAEA